MFSVSNEPVQGMAPPPPHFDLSSMQLAVNPAVNFSIANESSKLIVGFCSVSSLYFVYAGANKLKCQFYHRLILDTNLRQSNEK